MNHTFANIELKWDYLTSKSYLCSVEILIVTSTEFEVTPLLERFNTQVSNSNIIGLTFKGHHIHVLIGGIGIPETIYNLTKFLANNKVDLAIQMGVAGVVNRDIPLGTVVNVYKDTYGDLGVEDDSHFRTLAEVGLVDNNRSPFSDGYLYSDSNIAENLKKLSGITVNKVHGSLESIQKTQERLGASFETESMEGAAFLYVCLREHVTCLQIRAISNYIEKRNKDSWELELAIKNLTDETFKIIESI
ncbi:MAG: futalosine hydrolase [Flavobacteriales bacterium]|nr:futalosine hydrolase [Flavobacteriales bacterium]